MYCNRKPTKICGNKFETQCVTCTLLPNWFYMLDIFYRDQHFNFNDLKVAYVCGSYLIPPWIWRLLNVEVEILCIPTKRKVRDYCYQTCQVICHSGKIKELEDTNAELKIKEEEYGKKIASFESHIIELKKVTIYIFSLAVILVSLVFAWKNTSH